MDTDPQQTPRSRGSAEAVDSAIGPLNLPKRIARFGALKGVLSGGASVCIGIILCIILWAAFRRSAAPLIALGIFGGLGMVVLVSSWISYRQLTNAERKPATYEQFQTSTATEYRVPLHLQAAVIAPGEVIGNWYGPVNTRGIHGVGFQYLSSEIDVQAINTLLFTNVQVIGLMLGPDDMQNLLGSGRLKQTANRLVEYAPESGLDKGMQFQVLNERHWVDMVNALARQPLDAELAHYLNFGLPYERIEHVQIKARFVNPGLTFHLRDGSRLGYGSFKEERLSNIAAFLKPFVSVR